MATSNSSSKYVYLVLQEALSRGDINFLLDIGVPNTDVAWLQSLTSNELRELTSASLPAFDFELTTVAQNLKVIQSRIENHKDEENLLEIYIRRGATFPMANAMFGVTNYRFSGLKRLYGIESRGRPTQPDEEKLQEIWILWNEHESIPERERYLKISELTDVPLGSIYQVMSRWLTDSTRDTRRSKKDNVPSGTVVQMASA